MTVYKGFDINTATTPKPWGTREENAWKDDIDTLVSDTIGGVKNTSGHKHAKMYDLNGYKTIDANNALQQIDIGDPAEFHQINMNLKDDDASALHVKVNGYSSPMKVDTSASDRRTTIRSPEAAYPLIFKKDSNIYTRGSWVSWSPTIITGWSAYTEGPWVNYQVIGRLAWVKFHIKGTSDSARVLFNLPFTPQNQSTLIDESLGACVGVDNTSTKLWADCRFLNGVLNICAGPLAPHSSWTIGGTKMVSGVLAIQIVDAEF